MGRYLIDVILPW